MYISPDVHVITDKLKSVNGTVITTCAAAYWYWDRDLGGDSACHRNGWAAEVLRLRRQLGPSHEIGRAAVGGKLPSLSRRGHALSSVAFVIVRPISKGCSNTDKVTACTCSAMHDAESSASEPAVTGIRSSRV